MMTTEQLSDDESIDSQLEWELDEGIPQMDDPFIEKYMAGRDRLIEQEKKQRHDRLFIQTMSPLARQAARIMAAIRKRELQTKWTTQDQDALVDPAKVTPHPGMIFPLARERIQTTDVWRIVERMPKGALLHAHLDGMIDVDWLIDQALAEPGFCMYGTEGLDSDAKRRTSGITFKWFPDTEIQRARGCAPIWSQDYAPGTPVTVKEAQKTFPEGNSTFRSWLTSRCVLTMEELLRPQQGLDTIWSRFTSTFPVIGQMLEYEPIFRRAMQRLLGQLAADNISYVDFRIAFLFDFYLHEQTTPTTGYTEWFRVFGEEIEKFKRMEAGKSFEGARMIWTTRRALGNKALAESMKECIEIKIKYPNLICGFDCVGQEDQGRTLADLTPLLFWFKKKCHEAGVDIPFFFHAGECLGDGDGTDNNLFDAVLLGSRRIGHGYSLYKHPLLIDMVKEKKILIESCPISNEILRLSSSILSHTLPALLSRGVAVSLNNDDPAILGHGKNGLSHDFWQTFMAFENVGLEGLATMAENSLRWCAVEDQKQSEWMKGISDSYMGRTIKARMLKEWRSEFEKWCQWIIMEYPLEAGLDDEDEDEENMYDDEDE